MSKEVNSKIEFNGTLDEVFLMFQSESYLAKKSKYAIDSNFNVDSKNGVIIISLNRTFDLKAQGAPSAIRKIVGDELTLQQNDTWSKIDNSKYEGTVELKVKSLKVSGLFKCSLTAKGRKSELHLNGKIASSKALIGGIIEDQAVQYLDEVLQEEQDIGNDWLKENTL